MGGFPALREVVIGRFDLGNAVILDINWHCGLNKEVPVSNEPREVT